MRYADPDPEFERFLSRLNASVSAEFRSESLPGPAYRTLQIVGLPRSGTTFLFQVLAQTRKLGYPSNVMALFWRTPWVGARIHQHLANSTGGVSLHSLAGRTPEPLDPHEFGYFWRNALGHDSNALSPSRSPVSASTLRASLDAVTKVFEAPTVYKNFLAPAHVPFLNDVGGQQFIVVERPLEQVAASLLRIRRRLSIGIDQWFGVAPHEPWPSFESEIDRVSYQVAHVHQTIQNSGIVTTNGAVVVNYTDLCRDPRGQLGSLLERIDVSHKGVRWPEPREPEDSLSVLGDAERAALMSRLNHHLGRLGP